jgi:hypothetical protein
MAAFAKRGGVGSGGGTETPDPRAALMGALAKRGGGGGAVADPRSALMGALAMRGGNHASVPSVVKPAMPEATLESKHAKYLKMKKMGLPEGPIRQSMMKDAIPEDEIEVDVSMFHVLLLLFVTIVVICHESHAFLDASKLFFGNPPKKSAALSKEDLRTKYPKYVKMLSMGLPEGPVRQSMMKDSISSDEIEVYHIMHN